MTSPIIKHPLELDVIHTQPLILNVINTSKQTGSTQNKTSIQPLTLKVIGISENHQNIELSSDHLCYILKSSISNRTYIGYTKNFPHRIRQHNGEIVGGAKRTKKGRPWYPICHIRGFYESSSALRFEYRLQHPGRRKKKGEDGVTFILQTLVNLINSGDGSIAKNNKIPWPRLNIKWYDPRYSIQHSNVVNVYEC